MLSGDERCSRTAIGVLVGERWVPLLDDDEPADIEVRDFYYQHFGGANIGSAPPLMFAIKLLRLLPTHPRLISVGGRWLRRVLVRAGSIRTVIAHLRKHQVRPLTFVMHSFIDADACRPGWDQLRRGEISSEPRVREAQERLEACVYSMAHPETGELVPACVQHSILDPAENATLRKLLPIIQRAR